MIAFCFDVAVPNLIVEELGGLRLTRNTPVVIVEQPPEEMQLALLILHFNLHEVGKLASKSLDTLFQPRKVMFNLFNSILAGIAVFIGGFAFGHWATNSDPAFLRILAKSEKYKLRYDAAKQRIPRVEVV